MGAVGIDLGTTNTMLAVDRVVRPIGAFGATTLPSVVADMPDGGVLIGSDARRRRHQDPRNTVIGAKRLLGQPWGSEVSKRFAAASPLTLVEANDGLVEFQTRSGRRNPMAVGGLIVQRALELASETSQQAVITVPSEFSQIQRQATQEIGVRAGLSQVLLIDEPIAAAHAYLQFSDLPKARVAVFDLGGGTFDFAILSFESNGIKVIASGGDLYLGGDDIDYQIARWVAGEVLAQHNWNLADDRVAFSALISECEAAKIRLCHIDQASLDLHKVDPAMPASIPSFDIARWAVDPIALQVARRCFVVCDEVAARAGIQVRDLDAAFLAGGGAIYPAIRSAAESYFGKTSEATVNPMAAVAVGASILAQEVLG